MNVSLKGKKIMFGRDSNENKQNILKTGAIPVEVSNEEIKNAGGIESYYLQNMDKADGCYLTYMTRIAQRGLTSHQLKMSDYYFKSYYSALAINKNEKKFYSEINNVLHKMKTDGDLQSICRKNDAPDESIIC